MTFLNNTFFLKTSFDPTIGLFVTNDRMISRISFSILKTFNLNKRKTSIEFKVR
jgi:hypothetical protein